jgi:hypothetical protein
MLPDVRPSVRARRGHQRIGRSRVPSGHPGDDVGLGSWIRCVPQAGITSSLTIHATRDRTVPIVAQWQRRLLAFAMEHAQGLDGRLSYRGRSSARRSRARASAPAFPT